MTTIAQFTQSQSMKPSLPWSYYNGVCIWCNSYNTTTRCRQTALSTVTTSNNAHTHTHTHTRTHAYACTHTHTHTHTRTHAQACTQLTKQTDLFSLLDIHSGISTHPWLWLTLVHMLSQHTRPCDTMWGHTNLHCNWISFTATSLCAPIDTSLISFTKFAHDSCIHSTGMIALTGLQPTNGAQTTDRPT